MELKFYLNKFAKIDNIENYTFKNVLAIKKVYDRFLETSEGKDPDFPLLELGGGKKKGKTISKGKNIYSMFDEGEVPEDFKGIETRLKNKNLPEIRQEAPREARRRNTRNRNNKK